MELHRAIDPVRFNHDKLLVELVEPWVEVDPLSNQSQVDTTMRIHLAEWMAEVCTELDLEPEVFCLAVSCLDRFLWKVELRQQQLQLLGVTCLLVAWKVRGEGAVNVDALVRVSANSILKQEILECEMLVLTKLNWNLPSAVATDFIQHIAQKLRVKLPMTEVKKRVLELIQICYVHPALAVRSPQLLAAAAVITVIRPMLQPVPCIETPPTSYSSPTSAPSPPSSSVSPPPSSPSPTPTSSTPSNSSFVLPCTPSTPLSIPTTPSSVPTTPATVPTTSKESPAKSNEEEALKPHQSSSTREIPGGRRGRERADHLSKMDRIIRCVEKVTLSDKSRLQEVIEDIQNIVVKQDKGHPPTPSPETIKYRSAEYTAAGGTARHLFQDIQTPTKLLEASNFNNV